MLSTDKIMSLGSSSKLLFGASRKTRIVSLSAIFLAACAFGAAGVAPMAPDAANLPVRSITEELAVPSLAEQIAQLQAADHVYLREEKVRPGDTLASLLSRLGVQDDAAASFIKSDKLAYSVLQLKAGRRVQAQTNKDGQLQRLRATLSDNNGQPVKNVVISRSSDGFTATESSATLERRVEMHSGEIRSSLFAATDAAQIPDYIASQIVDMFATNIDFASDLRKGDRFNVVFETFWQDGEFVRAGRVLAGEFINGNNKYQSVWFDEPGSKQGGSYYSFDGKSLKKAFLKSPLEFSRISSGFSLRQHPISGQWKRHEGVDFAAPTGTAIRASGDGTVEFAGVQNGYGNVVVLKHWNNYSTAYAHMSRFAPGLKNGMKVSQGEVIGYVGSTGWSTGPHLHYEFRVNNQPRDPMSVDVPNAQPLAGAELQRFKTVASEMSHRFALLKPSDNTDGKDGGVKLAAK
ncbi:M23 family metallopeptidase [Noviherbaspirillum sp. Root189]|uniref:M23 family metallopeptidase n=1 Tax=Noviherbaspirillum sp. Root189 TaxID=1736487 RepID=UPI00070DD321|nr:peptidoglycan DD-metalloendopeptidase family protein [Noviherbaspirillum sp. Root189]KRB88587.1 peptidase M23 [Noviherbaspirillum sp. Root189]